MKSTKIIILAVVSVLLVAGVLIFAKTRLAPPSFVKLRDPFPEALAAANKSFDSISDYHQAAVAYISLDDKIVRFRAEDVIDNKIADDARKKMDTHFGKLVTGYGFSLFSNSVWNDKEINSLVDAMNRLATDRLSTGERGVDLDFMTQAGEITEIVNKYHEALKLSRSGGFSSVADAAAKIKKAQTFRNADYLRNNTALVAALNSLPKRLADSHYGYVKKQVGSLAGYRSVSKDYYMNTLVPRVQNAINEYSNTGIYGSAKQPVSPLSQQASAHVASAREYYATNLQDEKY